MEEIHKSILLRLNYTTVTKYSLISSNYNKLINKKLWEDKLYTFHGINAREIVNLEEIVLLLYNLNFKDVIGLLTYLQYYKLSLSLVKRFRSMISTDQLFKYDNIYLLKYLIENIGKGVVFNYREEYDELLMRIVSGGNISMLEYIINNNIPFIYSRDLIEEAIIKGNIEIFRLLATKFDNKEDLNEALLISYQYNVLNIFFFIIDLGADIYYENNIILREAIYKNDFRFFETLLNKGVDFRNSLGDLLSNASTEGYIKLVQFFIDQGADIHYMEDLPLRNAVYNNQYDVVKLLLDKGADINSKEGYVLRISVSENNIDIFRLLIDRGANPNLNELYDEHIIIKAISVSNIEMLKTLYAKGVDINVYNDRPIVYSPLSRSIEIIKFFLDRGSNIHAQDDKIVHFAATNDDLGVFRFVIENGANINSYNGRLGFEYAIRTLKIPLINLFIELGFDFVSHINDYLYVAIETGNIEMVNFFLNRGANIRYRELEAIKIACKNGRMNVLLFLIDKGIDINLYLDEALINAGMSNNPKLFKYLLSKGAKLENVIDYVNRAEIWYNREIINIVNNLGYEVLPSNDMDGSWE